MQDLRFALRMLSKSPVFAGLSVLLIALAMGLNTALFSVLYASVLEPLPYRDADRLVGVVESEPGRRIGPLTPANFDDVRRQSASFEEVTGYRENELELSGVSPPRRVRAVHCLPSFFSVLGVSPIVGRTLSGGDFHTASSVEDGLWSVGDVAVIGYGFWQRHYGGSREAIGSKLVLNDESVTVVGVMPEGFGALWREADLYVPWILPPDFWSVRPPHVLPMLARLADGVSLETASSEVATIYARLAVEFPETNEVLTASVEPLRARFQASTRTVTVLSAGALMVLIVACANLAGLLATRARSRMGEVAVRRALGASAARIAGQLTIESAVLAGAGGLLGIGIARVVVESLTLPTALPFSPELNLPVFGFSFVLLAGTAVLLGVVPAWLVSRIGLSESLRRKPRSHSGSRVNAAFVVVQVAVALGLVSASSLLLRSLTALERETLGLDAERLLTFYVRLPDTRYRDDDARRQFRRRALEELEALPGVSSAGTASHLPTTPMTLNLATAIEGRPLPRGTFRAAPVFVSHGLFRALGIPIREGRGFDERDSSDSPWMIVVNERMAEDFWPGQSAVGRKIRLEYPWAPEAPLTVIGVAPDVKQENIGREVRPAFFILHEQFPQEWFYFALRTRGAPEGIVGAVRERFRSLDPNLPVTDVQTMEERVEQSLAEHRARTGLVALYASAGILLAALGLYATLANLVHARTRELVIRMALGANRAHVTRLVFGHGMRQLGTGLALGLVLAFLAGRFVESLLFGVDPADGVSLAVTLAILAGVGVLAALPPTVRAGRLELANRLREE